MQKRILIGLSLVVVGVAGLIAALYYHDQTKTRTVRGSSSIEFITGQARARRSGRAGS
jgi:hypothetical protein